MSAAAAGSVGHRLYLRRYWQYERRYAPGGAAWHRPPAAQPAAQAGLADMLNQLFRQQPGDDANWQKVACALAARRAFCIVTGGPGTGKTTTVVRLLALLQALAVGGQRLRIGLAAPTGKAAARLPNPSLARAGPLKACPEETCAPPSPRGEHGAPPAGQPPGHAPLPPRRTQPAAARCAGAGRSLHARPGNDGLRAGRVAAQARLILLGDKDQLASVEAGAVLGDLCQRADAGWYSPQTRDWLEAVSGEQLSTSGLHEDTEGAHPLAQQVVMLRHSRRFGEGSGIGQLARWVNQQQADEARKLLAVRTHADLFSLALKGEHDHALERLLLEGHGDGPQGYRHYLSLLRRQRPAVDTALEDPRWTEWARDVLQAFDAFQLLCAVRKGPWGVEGLNLRITSALLKARLIDNDQQWYEGRPVLMTRNDHPAWA